MKRIVLICLMTTASLQATDLAEAWKQVSSYRIVSGIKGIVVGYAACHSAHQSYAGLKLLSTYVNDGTSWRSLDKANRIIGSTVLTLGMGYVTYKLSWDYFPVYARHALAIK